MSVAEVKPISEHPMFGVITDEQVEQLRERNAARVRDAQAMLGKRWLLAHPINATRTRAKAQRVTWRAAA